jgi:hypothetical protein
MEHTANVFEARVSKRYYLLTVAGSLALGVGSGWLFTITAGEPLRIVLLFNVAFFGCGSVLLATKLLDRKVQIRMSEEGLYSKDWSARTIPWSAIKDGLVIGVGKDYFLTLKLHDPKAFAPTTRAGKISERLNKKQCDMSVTLSGIDKSLDETMAALLKFCPRLVLLEDDPPDPTALSEISVPNL